MGPTASGKTDAAEALADLLGGRLINADAFQVYRGLDIGTGKSLRRAEYALMDLRDPDEGFGVGEWVELAATAITNALAEGRPAVLVGGTGFYIRALLEGYDDLQGPPDPQVREDLMRQERESGLAALAERLAALAPDVAGRTDLQNGVRVRRALERILSPAAVIRPALPVATTHKFALACDALVVSERIDSRAHKMVKNGWPDEVRGLLDRGYLLSAPGFRAHGYREMGRFVLGEWSLDEALATTIANVRRYAKRQRTWLRGEPRLTWVEAENPEGAAKAMYEQLHEG